MENRWIVIYGEYNGLQKKALNLINSAVFDHYNNYISFYAEDKITDELLFNNSVILVGLGKDNRYISTLTKKELLTQSDKKQGYSIVTGESFWNNENDMIVIHGFDEQGVLYGVVDFINQYCGYLIYKIKKGYMTYDSYYETPFHKRVPSWNKISSPNIETRAIWTWGHCIYDYKAFFDNMVMLKLNEIVIWNDHPPINANDVVDYAHSLGIKVIWGYAWGWGTDCKKSMSMEEEDVNRLSDEIFSQYEDELAGIKGDGIYFQSCTELNDEYIGNKLVAEVVVNLVNITSKKILDKYPSLQIQFGLHAESVKNRLDFISKVDSRVMIVWENCGAFPFYSENADQGSEKESGDIKETLDFTKTISVLRGKNEQFGIVLKGMTLLDWSTFRHQEDNLILGEKSRAFIEKRTAEKHALWKFRQANWLYNLENMRQIITVLTQTRKENTVQAVIEDGMIENEISFPAALYAETLWDCKTDSKEIITQVSKYPCVKFANT